jgi:hypothetical protein
MEKNKDKKNLLELLDEKSQLIKVLSKNTDARSFEIKEKIEALDKKIMDSIKSSAYTIDEI